jgi:futalosine hydrolase
MKHIAILSSVPFESELLLAKLTHSRKISIAGREAHKGSLFGNNVILLNTGIGKVNAALSATALLENFKTMLIINCGIGGAYTDAGLNPGDVAVATMEIYGDEGIVTSKGTESLEKIGIPILKSGKKKYFNQLPLDRKLSNMACSKASQISPIKQGRFVTVSAASATRKRAVELGSKYNAVCESMEGAAVAHVCTIYKVPMIGVRGISNIAGIRDKRRWKIKPASKNCQKAVMEIISSF